MLCWRNLCKGSGVQAKVMFPKHEGLDAFTRRDFFKMSGLGLMGLLMPSLPPHSFFNDVFETQQGRVVSRLLWTYDQPSFKGNQVKMFWRDLVVPITNVTVSDDQTAYNRVWYQIGNQGYAYSGDIQPVQTILNTPTLDIPITGILGEVSVPFTDALVQPDSTSAFGYRLYYESVHWIKSAVTNQQNGKIWYQVLDDKWNQLYYAPGEHLRILSADKLAPLSVNIPDAQKQIELHLNDQLLFAYENGDPVFVTAWRAELSSAMEPLAHRPVPSPPITNVRRVTWRW